MRSPAYMLNWSRFRDHCNSGLLVVCLLVTVLLVASGCNQNNDNGDSDMAYRNLETEVADLNLDDEQAMEDLAERIRLRAGKEPQELMKLVHSDDKETRDKASMLLLSVGATVLPALVEAIDSASVDNQVWDLETAVEIQLRSRARLVALLESMLSNKTPLPPPELSGHVEEKPPSLRACDQAYLILRSLMAMRATDAEMANREVFLDMEDSERDEEITRFMKTSVWTELQESLQDL